MNELIQTFFLVQYRIDFSNLVFFLVWIDCEKMNYSSFLLHHKNTIQSMNIDISF